MDPKLKKLVAAVQAQPSWAVAVESVRKTVREELGPGASFAEFESAVQTMMEAIVTVAVEELRQEQAGRAVAAPGGGKRRQSSAKRG